MDRRVAQVSAGGEVGWLHTDHQGGVIAVTDASGHAVQTASYSPYGEFASPGQMPPGLGAGGGLFGYTGRQYDAETGLYQYRARYYHPRLGQFLSTDPIGTEDDPNLTLYVLADPVNLVDPGGMQSACPLCNRIADSVEGVAERTREVVDHMWGTEEAPGTARMTVNWFTGRGPDNLEFGPDSLHTQELMASAGVAAARDYLYEKYDGAPPDGGSLTNYRVRFGVEGYATARTAAEHFVGSFRVDISVSDGRANFTITNNSSFRSLAYWIAPAWERSSFRSMGNMHQTYRWSEPIFRRRQ